MMKKTIAVVLCAAMALITCNGSASEDDKTDEGGRQKLVLSTYGLNEDISAGEVYVPFEQESNCEIVTETGGTNDRYTKLAAGSQSSINVIELSQATTAKRIGGGLFENIDLSKIENAKDMITTARTMAETGQGAAYTINSTGIMYDSNAVGFEIKSFDSLWGGRLQGMVSVPEITTTFGSAMVYVVDDHVRTDIESDQVETAFQALEQLKPSLAKTYTKSSDLISMLTSGEVAMAVVRDFGVPTIQAASPDLVYMTPDTTYTSFNTISITKSCRNKRLAYEYLNYRLSPQLQTRTGKTLNEAPTNSKMRFTEEESKNMAYGENATNAEVLDYSFVNPQLNAWTSQWDRIINDQVLGENL